MHPPVPDNSGYSLHTKPEHTSPLNSIMLIPFAVQQKEQEGDIIAGFDEA